MHELFPVLFQVNGHDVALLMQVVWALAAAGYYALLLRLRPRYR